MLLTLMPGCWPISDADIAPQGQGQQRGATLLTYEQDGYESLAVGTNLEEIAGVGAEWVQLVPTWYQSTETTNDIQRTSKTPSDSSIQRAISLAHEQGLKVLLKPHVDLLNGEGRHKIRPSDPGAWFASYTVFITHYAQLAAQLGVEQFSVGAELAEVSGDRAAWLEVIKVVRAQYGGPLVYAATHLEYTKVPFWDALDLIGVDAYWPLSDQPTYDVAKLEEAWRPLREELGSFSARIGRPILFTEAGYASQRGTTTRPYSFRISNQPDQAEQAAAYQALLASFDKEDWWAGVFWWAWGVLTSNVNADETLYFAVDGKAAQEVLRTWWGRRER